ncbi:MAG: molybdenum cofactor biosynthesis protein MoaA, partial [Candidatus Bathyarchaeota archaeon]|nr:molybdenum cofactor biosynthesis protein MoaA [Candidatus Bathyarchaeota archaeon]
AVMLSFSSKAELQSLLKLLVEVDKKLAGEVEEEYVFLYPHVVERLKKSGIKPKVAYKPNKIPGELV